MITVSLTESEKNSIDDSLRQTQYPSHSSDSEYTFGY